MKTHKDFTRVYYKFLNGGIIGNHFKKLTGVSNNGF